MAKIFLHIGAPKTATSSLQHLFAAKAQSLAAAGLIYPGSFRNGEAHHTLACDLMDEFLDQRMPDFWYGSVPRGSAWASLQEEIAALAPDQTVLLSSELFFAQGVQFAPAIEAIAQRLAGHDVRILVYLRRQDQMYGSFFNQDVKGARRWPHDAYRFYQTDRLFEENYHAKLGYCADAFGRDRLVVRPFERESSGRGEVSSRISAS